MAIERLGLLVRDQIVDCPEHIFLDEDQRVALIFNKNDANYVDVLVKEEHTHFYLHEARHHVDNSIVGKMQAKRWAFSPSANLFYCSDLFIDPHVEKSRHFVYVLLRKNFVDWKVLHRIDDFDPMTLVGEFIITYDRDTSVLISERATRQCKPKFHLYRMNGDLGWERIQTLELPEAVKDNDITGRDIVLLPDQSKIYIKRHVFLQIQGGTWRYIGEQVY